MTSSGATSARRVPARAPSASMVPIAAVMRSRVAGVARRPEAQALCRVLSMERFVATKAA